VSRFLEVFEDKGPVDTWKEWDWWFWACREVFP